MAKRDMPKIDETLDEKTEVKEEVEETKKEVKETKPVKKSGVAKAQ